MQRGRFPYFVVLFILFLFMATVATLAFWIDGSAPVGSFGRPFSDSFFAPFAIFIMIYLPTVGTRALNRFVPALEGADPAVVRGYHRRLTGLTNGQFALSALIGTAIATVAFMELVASGETREMGATTLTTIVMGFITVGGYGIGVIAIALMIRVLSTIPDVHRAATVIDLRRPRPLHAFAPLSARIGILLLLIVAYNTLTDPTTREVGTTLTVSIAMTSVAFVAFFLPLLGMRRRLSEQKSELLDEAAKKISAIEGELETALEKEQGDRLAFLKSALDIHQAKRDRIARASTMPWDVTTIRSFATALLIPLATYLITNFLNRTLFG